MNEDIEEVIELKKCFKKFMIYIIILTILSIPTLILTFQIIQKTATINNILLHSVVILFILPSFITTWQKFNKQYIIAEKAIFKNILLKIGSEEYVSEETNEELCQNLKRDLNNNEITNINHIIKLKINYTLIDFFMYETSKQTTNFNNYNFETYNAMAMELSEKNTIEKYEKVLLEKNKKFKYNYSLTTSDNKLIISVIIDKNFDILQDYSNPIADFFKDILLEIKL